MKHIKSAKAQPDTSNPAENEAPKIQPSAPLVSLVVAIYNIEKYLPKCLDSLTSQTYKDLEIILIDDGSTDNSGKYCDIFAKKCKTARVIRQKNAGLSAVRNTGLKLAKGEFVAFIDGDDYLEPHYVENLVENLDPETDLVVCGYFENAGEISRKDEKLTGKAAAKRLLIEQENIDLVAWNKLYRISLFKNIEYPVGQKYEDCLTTYKLFSHARNVKYLNKPLYHYVHRPDSITSNQKLLESLTAREQAARESIEYLKGTDLENAAKISLLTAKFACLDAFIAKKIDSDHGAESWIKAHREEYLKNPELTKKLRLYLKLGKAYKTLRKIRH